MYLDFNDLYRDYLFLKIDKNIFVGISDDKWRTLNYLYFSSEFATAHLAKSIII